MRGVDEDEGVKSLSPHTVSREGRVLCLDLALCGASLPRVGHDAGRGETRRPRPQESVTPFRRGDSNDDGRRELSDVVFLLDALFRAGPAPSCRKAADANDDGRLNVSDAAVMLLYLFRNGVPLPQPFEDCGLDPTPDSLGCKAFSPCS